MIIDELKTAWALMKKQNSLLPISEVAILDIIEPKAEKSPLPKIRVLSQALILIVLMMICQGG